MSIDNARQAIPGWGLRVCGCAAVAALLLNGCQSTPSPKGEPTITTVVAQPLPSFQDAVARYNEGVLPLDRLIARATIRLTYTDRDGERHTEQPDGTLQIVRPNKLAIDLGKAGKKLFWLGSDEERYWWIDLSNPDDRFAAVGRHDHWDANQSAAGRRLGIGVRPLDLIAAIGITPLDPKLKGATQWSRDGRRLGIVSPLPGRNGLQRVWVDPKTMRPSSIELFNADHKLVLRADMEGEERVTINRTGVPGSVGERPVIPARITCDDIESDAELRITLSDAKDGPISDKAFRLDELVRRLGVGRVVDLDRPIADDEGGAGAK